MDYTDDIEREKEIRAHWKRSATDWANFNTVHKELGHETFVAEAKLWDKNDIFINNVCTNQNCTDRRR